MNLSYRSKLWFTLFTIVLSTKSLLAQQSINTPTPQGVFHIDGGKNNPKGSIPNSEQQKDDFIVLKNGNVGIATILPENKLHIKADSNPLKLEGLQTGSTELEELLIIDKTGTINKTSLKKSSIPQPAVLSLTQNMNNFLYNIQNGFKQRLTPLNLEKNTIQGLTFNSTNSTVSFPKGTYQINFVYEATHNSSGCTLSSYFVDFPTPDAVRRRVHTSSRHNQGAQSSHGGTITFTVTLTADQTIWYVELGRGQSGNCTATSPFLNSSGMTLMKDSTQILIFRIGD